MALFWEVAKPLEGEANPEGVGSWGVGPRGCSIASFCPKHSTALLLMQCYQFPTHHRYKDLQEFSSRLCQVLMDVTQYGEI